VARIVAGDGPAAVPSDLAARAVDAALGAAADTTQEPTLLGRLVWLGTRATVAAFGLAGVLVIAAHIGGPQASSMVGRRTPSVVATDALSSWMHTRQTALEQEAVTLVSFGVAGEQEGSR